MVYRLFAPRPISSYLDELSGRRCDCAYLDIDGRGLLVPAAMRIVNAGMVTVGGVSSKAAASIFVPSIAVPSRPPRSFWIPQIYRSSVPLSISLFRPHLANDEAHALYHGYACSESTSASLRPKGSFSQLRKNHKQKPEDHSFV